MTLFLDMLTSINNGLADEQKQFEKEANELALLEQKKSDERGIIADNEFKDIYAKDYNQNIQIELNKQKELENEMNRVMKDFEDRNRPDADNYNKRELQIKEQEKQIEQNKLLLSEQNKLYDKQQELQKRLEEERKNLNEQQKTIQNLQNKYKKYIKYLNKNYKI